MSRIVKPTETEGGSTVVEAGERRDRERQPMDPGFFGVMRMAGMTCGEGYTTP